MCIFPNPTQRVYPLLPLWVDEEALGKTGKGWLNRLFRQGEA